MKTQETIRYSGRHCELVIEHFFPNVIILILSGMDVGEFGDTPMQELNKRIENVGPVQFFIDARKVVSTSIDVSGDWAHWLRDHKAQLETVAMLTGTRFIEVTADFVRRYADLEGVMRIYTEAAPFDAAVDVAIGK